MDIQGTQKNNCRKTSFVQSILILSNYDVFDEFKNCHNLVSRILRDAHHKFSVDFLKQCSISMQKWNFTNKKLGNHKQGINVSEIETNGAKAVDKKAICNAFKKSFAIMGKCSVDFVTFNIHKMDQCPEKFNSWYLL